MSNNSFTTITIDGPVGSGKGVTARKLAEKLGFKYLDTGAMYRALGVYLHERGKDLEHITEVDVEGVEIGFSTFGSVQIYGIDYESRIRTPEAGKYASQIAGQQAPRDCILGMGKQVIKTDNYVIEGRDTGTFWAPDAQVKIYLTADATVRAHRRWLEFQKAGNPITEKEVLQQICERDNRDMTRAVAPLRKPDDAIEVDCSAMTVDEQVEKIYEIVKDKISVYTF